MSSQAVLFKILFQNDTLYQLNEKPHSGFFIDTENREIIDEKPIDKVASVAAATPHNEVITSDPPVIKVPPIELIPQVAAPKVEIAATKNFPALNHKILILTDEPKQKVMLASESLFLDNILKAVKYSIDNADIINISFLPDSDARSVLAEKKTNYFITFGVPLIKLHLDLLLIPYTPKFVEGIWFLLTDPLVVIEADRDLKKKLWQALQKMFERSN